MPTPQRTKSLPEESQISSAKIFAVSALSGGLLILAFPRFNLFPLAWVGLIPWLILLPYLNFRQAALSGLSLGLVFFAGLLSWVGIFGYLPWLLLAAIEAIFIFLAGLGIWLLRARPPFWRIVGTASLWTVFEWLRGQGAFGFPWGMLGHSQSPWLGLIQIASLTGVPGLTFLLVLHNAAWAEFFRWESPFKIRICYPLAVGLLLAAMLWVGGGLNKPESGQRIKVAVVQPSYREPGWEDVIEGWSEIDVTRYLALLKQMILAAAEKKPDLIILPESALPLALNQEPWLQAWVRESARETSARLLLGAIYQTEREYNAAYLFSPRGEPAGRYDKVQLVPFGEYVPGRNWLPGLQYYPIRENDLAPGKSFAPLAAGSCRLGVSICFESIFSHISRASVRRGANLLAVITNDGWFKRTAAPAQHQQIAVFRAVENRRWLGRATTTGISCFISPRGKIKRKLDLYRSGFLLQTLALETGETFYRRHGDWFVGFAGLLAVLSCFGGKRSEAL
jgi:apolipoprotein N-acyltransferase